ncbi:MAG TPA: GGDEF domain-containing protein [Desulfosporosinus sp.]|nr:GGDEF domain-containing protein [Desulfosporosinus sp.]
MGSASDRRIIARYTLIGIAFGLIFPISALLLEIYTTQLPFVVNSIIQAHIQNKLIFIIDTAPIFLGLFAMTGGVIQASAKRLCIATKNLEQAREELKMANQESYHNSITDALTGLPNRRRLDDFMATTIQFAQRTGSPVSVMMVDIDHFKAYNDNYGHLQGDSCLKAIADVLSSIIKRSVDLVARYGGEEFVIILADTDSAGAVVMAEQLRASAEALAIHHEFSHTASVVTISIGFATVQTPAVSFDTLLDQADQALYQAKRGCRNCCVQLSIGNGDE